ncbi:uncharacterized protein E0L32_011863 [Thyridium curvatum]|uniref:Uncharacterized protein n=1 Tax=Thyridium curvatum TaxID=1093900 RepID=A0A507BGY1_9PEZI|nr:uncharacterized protein E0L32_011863 [Thyridium curvatum]TPX18044.1 hypothetical protein E0L32_011863 [Thyridium curvatum]
MDSPADQTRPIEWVNLVTVMQGSSPHMELPPMQSQSSVWDIVRGDLDDHPAASAVGPSPSSSPSLPRLEPATSPQGSSATVIVDPPSATQGDPVQRALEFGESLVGSHARLADISRTLVQAGHPAKHSGERTPRGRSAVDDSRPLAEFDVKELRRERDRLAAACGCLDRELLIIHEVASRAGEVFLASAEKVVELSGLIDRLDRLNEAWSAISVRDAETLLHGAEGGAGLKRKASAEMSVAVPGPSPKRRKVVSDPDEVPDDA